MNLTRKYFIGVHLDCIITIHISKFVKKWKNWLWIVLDCECNNDGSTSNDCNVENGHCDCINDNIIGDKCDSCREGYFNHPDCEGTTYHL